MASDYCLRAELGVSQPLCTSWTLWLLSSIFPQQGCFKKYPVFLTPGPEGITGLSPNVWAAGYCKAFPMLHLWAPSPPSITYSIQTCGQTSLLKGTWNVKNPQATCSDSAPLPLPAHVPRLTAIPTANLRGFWGRKNQG